MKATVKGFTGQVVKLEAISTASRSPHDLKLKMDIQYYSVTLYDDNGTKIEICPVFANEIKWLP